MASEVLGGDDCGSSPDACNVPMKLQDALGVVERRTAGGTPNLAFPAPQGPLPFSEIQKHIKAKLPVCARIEWEGGGGHFVVISGYRQPGRILEVVDPAPDADGVITGDDVEDDVEEWQYEAFLSAYGEGGTGEWTDTFLVQVR
jgi:hypothetical protein